MLEKPTTTSDVVPGRQAQLMRRAAEGDHRAFTEMYDQLRPRLYALARRVVRSHAEAEDVLQEACCVAWQQAARYRPTGATPGTWLAAIVRYKGIDHLRRQLRAETGARHAAALVDPPGRLSVTGGEAALASESTRAVQHALASLSQPEHRAIALSFFQGLTHVEISQRLALPIGTVKARIRRGIEKLRPMLREHSEHPFAPAPRRT